MAALGLGSLLLVGAQSRPAAAIVGGTPVPAGEPAQRWTVMIEGSSGRLCSGVSIGPSLVLTAAHCTVGQTRINVTFAPAPNLPPRRMQVVEFMRHPTFQPDLQPRLQAGVDLALIWLGSEAPHHQETIELEPNPLPVGAAVSIFGFGALQEEEIETARTLRQTTLEHVGVYRHSSGATAQFAQDPDTKAQRAGRGACGGDSGGPVLTGSQRKGSLVGIISWSTGPSPQGRCGGYTAFVPMSAHADWVVQAAEELARRHVAGRGG
jgi:secreted trypsin-like serine protease